jgi:hypothetical protein
MGARSGVEITHIATLPQIADVLPRYAHSVKNAKPVGYGPGNSTS